MGIPKDSYSQHVFYTSKSLGLKKKKAILEDAYQKCYEWWVDELDCSISYTRRKIEMSFVEIMKMLDKKSHFVIIHRRGFTPEDQNNIQDPYRWYLEIGFCTMVPEVNHYLWIQCEQDLLPYFIEKYKLKISH